MMVAVIPLKRTRAKNHFCAKVKKLLRVNGKSGLKTSPIPFVLPLRNQITVSVASGDKIATTIVIDPYRIPPPTHQALDIACRRCSKHPLIYAYFPYVLPVPGPLCRECLIEWVGVSETQYATVGTGLFSYPSPMGALPNEWEKYVVPSRSRIKVITVPGSHPDISPWIE